MKFLKFLVCVALAASICAFAACAGEGGTTGGGDNNIVADGGSTDDEMTDGGSTDDEGTADGSSTDEGTTDDGSTDEGTTDEEDTSDGGSTDEGSASGGTDDGTWDSEGLLESLNEVIDTLLGRPDVFSFLPASLTQENLAYNAVQTEDFSSGFVSTAAMLTRFTGRQMHVVQGVLSRSSTILSGADVIFTAGEVIAQAYRSFIADNPDDYDEFSTQLTIAGSQFDISISVSGTAASLSAENGTVSIILNSDTSSSAEWRNSGLIQLGDSGVLKYGFSEDSLSLALKFTLAGVSYMQYLTFERDNGEVCGELTEFVGTGTAAVKTCALIYSNDETTAVISNKREGEDLSIDSFAEVYSSVSGEYLAGEVTETADLSVGFISFSVEYDTVWVPLGSVSGITSVRVTDKAEDDNNSRNSNSVYINGSETPLAVEYNSKLGISTSRHYDIEMRTVWYYVLNADGEVEEREVKIPMLFVQRENVDDFTAEMYKNNGIYASLPTENIGLVGQVFDNYSVAYEEYKEQITFDWLSGYIESL